MRWVGHVARTGKRRGVYRVSMRKGRGQLGDPEVDKRIILKWIIERAMWGMDHIGLAKDRDRWRALVNAAITLPVS
jgi:hypothetical protein